MYLKPGCLITIALLTAFSLSTAHADKRDDDDDDDREDEQHVCLGSAPSILSVADFNGNGIVEDSDIHMLKKAKKRDNYYAFYDINADGELDKKDIYHAYNDLGKNSTAVDQQLAKLFHYNKQLQLVDSAPEALAMDYIKVTESLSGHGEHWINIVTDTSGTPFLRPEGINFSADTQSAKGLFWSVDAIPVFEDGVSDFPDPQGEWRFKRVIAFAGHPPKLTSSEHETWHTHAGLCFTADMGEKGPVIVLNQHTTFDQCQNIPTLFKTGGDYNLWSNIWMLHAWMFDLNPNGFFANTHPCVDPNSPAEHTINGDREVPPFFEHHH